MTIDEIKELIHVVNETGIAELEVTRGDNRVRIKRSNLAATTQEIVLPAAPALVAAAAPALAAAQPASSNTGMSSVTAAAASASNYTPAAPIPDETSVYVKSPIVGTFYESASPGSPPFVKVGAKVSPGQVLCIIESMKLMNEIECEVSGTVISKLVENGQPVEYGEALFAIQPA